MDEVFGRSNFIDTVIWRKNYSPKSSARHFSSDHDYILVYARNAEAFKPNLMPRTEKQDKAYKNPDNDPRGPWKTSDLSARNFYSLGKYAITSPSGREIKGPPGGNYWRVSEENFWQLDADNRIWWGKNGDAIPQIKRFLSEVKQGVTPQTIWSYEEVGHTQEAKKEILKLFDEDVFLTPKPERLMQRVMQVATNSKDLVLDSFLGSGTTAAVAHKMGRRYIAIELGEHAVTHCAPRLQKVIEGEPGGISEAVGWQGGGGFRYYRLGPPVFDEEDLPQLTEDQAAHRPLVAAHAVPWPGEMAVFRSPSTDGFELLTTFGSRARIGALVSDFYAGPTSRFDLGNALVVDLLTGTLESITDLTLFGGANALAIESAPGVWEVVQAGVAELLAPSRYRLTRLLRGQRGTEGAMGDPAPAGARVVVLDDSLASLPIAEADLGIPWNWRIGPASRPVSDETYVAQTFAPAGIGLRPFSVAHVEQPWRIPRTPGDLTIRWTRRSRALSADNWGGLEVPLAEELEAYEVEILDDGTVKRVLSTTTTSAVYTAAGQTADWGAPLGPGDTLDIRIFQFSALVGRGAPKTVTLIL